MNSPFCTKLLDTSLRLATFNRDNKGTCQCSRVDWCGCSPEYIKQTEKYVKKLDSKSHFFARKFDPIFNQGIINLLDERVNGKYPADFLSLHSFWLNFYDKKYGQLKPKIQMIVSYLESIGPNLKKAASELIAIEAYFYKDRFKG